jgi:hypothetical protein
MDEYRAIIDRLTPAMGSGEDLSDIPEDVLKDAYAGLMEFAEVMDYELAKMVTDSVKEYRLPPEDEELFDKIDDHLAKMDWDGIKEIIKDKL